MATNGNANPLDRTPDMEGLSAADRARIYKERAAAAGIGGAPNPEAGGAEAAPPPTEKPAAGQPAPDGAGRGNGGPARPAPAATGAGGAAAPAAAAPVATKAGGAGALTPEQRERLAAATQRGSAQAAGGTATVVSEQQQRLVYVWPHLVTIELLASMLMLLSMFVIGYVLQAPLEAHANADRTPNPSKAPWYFLNLQELLLHMHPALAGVLVPSGALALIAIIPYFDRNTRDVGKWFGTPKALPIFWFTTWYTTVVLIVQIMFDEYVGVKPMMARIAEVTRIDFFKSGLIVDIVVPLFLMTLPIIILVGLLRRIYRPDGARDWMIAFFTGFLVVYIVLTIFGTFFRGQGMHLYWPWDPAMIRIE